MIRHQWLVFLPMTLATAGLAACASLMEGDTVKVRPVESKPTQASAQHDPLYESAVVAINERDYGRALDYLQAAKDKNPGNVKILNALGVVYDKLGRFDLSARYYAQASAIEPDSKIVAENRGYSQVLQRLMNPGAPVAVATIDLPAGLTAQAAPQKPVAVTAMNSTAPAVLQPEAKPVAATPAKPYQPEDYTHQSVTIFTAGSADIASAPMQPEAKWVVAPAIGSVSGKLPVWTAPSLPSPEVSMAPRSEAKAEPVSASALAMPAKPVIARQEPASATPPATVVAALPPERTVTYHPEPMATSVVPSAPAPVATATESKPAIISAAPAPIAAAIAPPVPRNVTAPSLLPAAPLKLAALKPAVLPVIAAAEPAPPVVQNKPVMTAAVPAVPSTPAPAKAPTPEVIPTLAKAAEPVAPKPAIGHTVLASVSAPDKKPLAVSVPVMTAALPEHRATPVVVPVQKKTELASLVPAAPARPAAAKPVVVASLITPVQKPAMPAIKPVAKAEPVKAPAAKPAMKPAPVKMAVAKPAAPAWLPANRQVGGRKVLTIGQPVRLLNASGKAGGTGTVLHRLGTLGWSMRAFDAHAQPVTMLYYSPQNVAAAKALQRTLPFPVRLTVDKANSGMRLVIGRDYLSWKPRNSHLASLWQRSAVTATFQKASIKGVR